MNDIISKKQGKASILYLRQSSLLLICDLRTDSRHCNAQLPSQRAVGATQLIKKL
jgi:hypothetical protein